MGLDILSDTSKSEATKIDQLTKLMSITHNEGNELEITENLISEFIKIDAKAPNDDIATDTPWPKALRVFAQKILSDASSSKITNQDRILALTTYLNELKSGASDVSSTQTIRQSNHILINNSTMKSAGDFLKKISEVSVGADGKKDISLIKAFNAEAAAAAERAAPAPAPAPAGTAPAPAPAAAAAAAAAGGGRAAAGAG